MEEDKAGNADELNELVIICNVNINLGDIEWKCAREGMGRNCT